MDHQLISHWLFIAYSLRNSNVSILHVSNQIAQQSLSINKVQA